jgi:hypothetical protein
MPNLHEIVMALYKSDPLQYDAQLDHLSEVLERWVRGGQKPEDLPPMAAGERAAVRLAGGDETGVDSALETFLYLDPHLQKFVLRARKLDMFIGHSIADFPNP